MLLLVVVVVVVVVVLLLLLLVVVVAVVGHSQRALALEPPVRAAPAACWVQTVFC